MRSYVQEKYLQGRNGAFPDMGSLPRMTPLTLPHVWLPFVGELLDHPVFQNWVSLQITNNSLLPVLGTRLRSAKKTATVGAAVVIFSDDEDEVPAPFSRSRGRGRGGKAALRGGELNYPNRIALSGYGYHELSKR